MVPKRPIFIFRLVFIALLLATAPAVADEIIPHYAIFPVWDRVEHRISAIKEFQAIHDDIGRSLGGTWGLYNAANLGKALKHDDALYYIVDVSISFRKSSSNQRKLLPFLTVLVPIGNISGAPFIYKKGENIIIPYVDWVSNEFPEYMNMDWKAYIRKIRANGVIKTIDRT